MEIRAALRSLAGRTRGRIRLWGWRGLWWVAAYSLRLWLTEPAVPAQAAGVGKVTKHGMALVPR